MAPAQLGCVPRQDRVPRCTAAAPPHPSPDEQRQHSSGERGASYDDPRAVPALGGGHGSRVAGSRSPRAHLDSREVRPHLCAPAQASVRALSHPPHAPLQDHQASHVQVHRARGLSLLPTLYTLHPTPYTLHPTPYSLLPTPYTLLPTVRHGGLPLLPSPRLDVSPYPSCPTPFQPQHLTLLSSCVQHTHNSSGKWGRVPAGWFPPGPASFP